MIANIVDWMKCFTTYVAAMAIKFPESLTEMLAYQLVIIKASQQYDGLYWRVYDTHFRVNAAASGNRKWSQQSLTQTCTRDSLRAGQLKYHTVYSETPPAIPMHSARKAQGGNAPNPLTLYQQLRNENGRAMYVFPLMRPALASLKTASMSTSAVCAREITQLSSVLNRSQSHQTRGSSLQSDSGCEGTLLLDY